MRQQNADMSNTTIIPIFGYTPTVQKQQITIDGQTTTVELAMATTKNIIRIEATPLTWNLHKYLVIVKNDKKSSVMKNIQQIFQQIEGPLENQPENFPFPRCGGSEKRISTKSPNYQKDTEIDKSTTSYMVGLETLALANNPQDAGPSSPPKRQRKFNISYASAAKAGLIPNSDNSNNALTQNQNIGAVTPENANTQDSETTSEKSLTAKNIDAELQKIKEGLESRMQKQEEQMSEIIQVIKAMNDDFEKRMVHVILAALSKEKEKVQELTHGRVFHASDAPLADDAGNLPYGGKVQLGGPLDRLHHVEVTIVQMSNALDSILEHLQKDPTAKYLFKDEDSETPTIIENPITAMPQQQVDNTGASENHYDDTEMIIKDQSGTKRQLPESSPLKKKSDDSTAHSSPNRSPPPKKRSENPTSADPDATDRERGRP
jgi:hypothetical protein